VTTFVKLANGNYQGDVQLLPEAYEALSATTKREGGSYVDHINAALVAYDMITRTEAYRKANLS
jgi:hypothetical protein